MARLQAAEAALEEKMAQQAEYEKTLKELNSMRQELGDKTAMLQKYEETLGDLTEAKKDLEDKRKELQGMVQEEVEVQDNLKTGEGSGASEVETGASEEGSGKEDGKEEADEDEENEENEAAPEQKISEGVVQLDEETKTEEEVPAADGTETECLKAQM